MFSRLQLLIIQTLLYRHCNNRSTTTNNSGAGASTSNTASSSNDSQYENQEAFENEREASRLQARQALTLTAKSLTRFVEGNLRSDVNPTTLEEHFFSVTLLLRQGLQLVDLLLEQLAAIRRELESDDNDYDTTLSGRQATRNGEPQTATASTNTTATNETQSSTVPPSTISNETDTTNATAGSSTG